MAEEEAPLIKEMMKTEVLNSEEDTEEEEK